MSTARNSQEPSSPFEKGTMWDALRGMGVLYAGPAALAGWSLGSIALGLRDALRSKQRSRLPVVAGMLVPLVYFGVLRQRMLFWGATPEEMTKPLPGDEIIPNPMHQNTRAITINANAAEVWRWLVQIGYRRGGWYSYDALEAAAGAGDFMEGRSATRIHEELQHLKPGDVILMSPWTGLSVRTADFGSALTLESMPMPGAAMPETSWSMVLEPVGPDATRLLIRGRSRSDPRNLVMSAFESLIEMPHFIMERKMMLGIKKRAEAQARRSASRPSLIDTWAPDLRYADTIGVDVDAPPDAIFAALNAVTVADMPLARALGDLRYLPGRLLGKSRDKGTGREPFLQTLRQQGTVVLAEEPGRELVLGGAGKYHQVSDQQPVGLVDAARFVAFDDPEYQKLVISVRVEPGSRPGRNRLVLEHRTQPLSDASARRFERYWRVIKPSGAFVSKQLLLAVKKRAEATVRETVGSHAP